MEEILFEEAKEIAAGEEPIWDPRVRRRGEGSVEIWGFKLNDSKNQRALLIQYNVLISSNGFKRTTESWAVLFQRNSTGEVEKSVLKETQDVNANHPFRAGDNQGFRLGQSEFSAALTRGKMTSKGAQLEWDLRISQGSATNRVHREKMGLILNSDFTVGEDLRFSGVTRLNGEEVRWDNVPGRQAHFFGSRLRHSWTWGHCNSFVDEGGAPAEFLFEGSSVRNRLLGGIPSPQFSNFVVQHRGSLYRFSSVWDSLRTRAIVTPDGWEIGLERGDLNFSLKIMTHSRDFAGLTYEDTNGSLLYSANSQISSMSAFVYRKGKLESRFKADSCASLERVSRHKSPYVPMWN